ncbi:MAG: AsmA family protein [Mucilaginibacter polytrichastri]|nr:AsmA family protein [Mucilaginibacter polytrichastri]
MPRWLKITLRTLGSIMLLLVVLSLSAVIYVAANKQKILRSITETLSRDLNGTITVKDLSPSFFSGFSGISVTLKGVSIRDDNWKTHQHDLVSAEKLQTSVNAWSLLHGAPEITRIGLIKARVFLYTDSTGYSNVSVFKKDTSKRADPTAKNPSPLKIGQITMDDVDFTMENLQRHKLFHFGIRSLRAKMDFNQDDWAAKVNLKGYSYDLSFNTHRGSFMKNQELDGSFHIRFSAKQNHITFAQRKLTIGKTPFLISADFDRNKEPLAYKIRIRAHDIRWRDASSLLADNISRKLNMFDMEQPITVNTLLDGDFGAEDPMIEVRAGVRNNTLHSPAGTISNCTFDGLFTNQNQRSKPRTNQNSAIKFSGLKGDYEGLPFQTQNAQIIDLDTPIASGIITSDFDISKLNKAIGSPAVRFKSGNAHLNLRFSADIVNYQFAKPVVNGDIDVRNANLSYVPRNIDFRNSSITLSFRGNDLFLKNIRVQSGRSIVNMNGSVRNFLNFYYTAPEKIVVNWDVSSPQIYLAEFLGYLGNQRSREPAAQSAAQKRRVKKASVSAAERIDDVLEKSTVNMQLRISKLFYKRFEARNAKANLSITQAGLKLHNLHVDHAGGFLNLRGNVVPQGNVNRFALNADVKNVNVSTFFYAFDNFGIDGLSYKNLKGNFSSKVDASGIFTNEGSLVQRSMTGTVRFDLKNGALVNFPPLLSVSKIAFRKRGLDNITFTDLNGKLDIRKEKIFISPMRISSSAINMDVAGVYALTRGTHITIDIPLRNPKKDEKIGDEEKKKRRRMNGLVVHLLATDEEDGKMQIKWKAGI